MTAAMSKDLTFDQTVPRAIAHRRAVGEVFVTDSAQITTGEFLLAWQVPRAHSLWGDRLVPFHDPFSLAEVARQGCFVVMHRHMDIALELPMSLRRFEFRVTSGSDAYRDDERTPMQGLLRYRLGEQNFQGDELGTMTLHGELERDGVPVMTISGDIIFLPRGDYEELRAFQRSRKPLECIRPWQPAAPVAPVRVGRRDPRNVVVGEPVALPFPAESWHYPLVIDRGHPSYFDHDYDHVPGPFLLEGFRQAVLLEANRAGLLSSPGAAVTGLVVAFAEFGEFEAPLDCSVVATADVEGRVNAQLGLHQFGSEIAEGRVELTPYV